MKIPLDPELQRALTEAAPDDTLRVIVHLRQQADLGAAVVSAQGAGEARAHLVSALQATAARSQAPLRAYLEEAQTTGAVRSYTSFWIVNAVAIHAARDTVFALAARPEIAAIHLDHYRQWLPSNQYPATSIQYPVSSTQYPASSIEWGIERIRAPQVWSSLHISGTGAVVAGVDTGVDWLHPALQTSYRGYNPHGPANHTYSWYDATEAGALYPVDGHGHGSHTLGTVVGRDGIGVAPGARWIGVKVLNNQGYGYDSWIHAGFQWLLAPGGDPAQAPDVVNCSWGNRNGYLTTFQDDLRALRAADILAVFSSGNDGPREGTVGSPASLPEAFAVGATDEYDEVASFSSRGASPWGEIRPHVAAPGVHVRSSTPGGAYGAKNGTSMAAPHASGIVAMLRSVSPTLSITHTAYLITSTAVPLGDVVPNNDTGWGRVDAFAAVAALARPGFITGTVRETPDPETQVSNPIAGATVIARPHGGGGGGAGTDTTDEDGGYLLALAPGVYDLSASAFGYEPDTAWRVAVVTDSTAVRNFALTPLPTGGLRVRVTDASAGQPITATVGVLDTPHEVTTHTHTFDLPVGTYTVRARRLGYRVVTATAVVTVGETSAVNLALPPAPSILLVDSGGWYYKSQAGYFRQALDDLSYAYHEWPIRHLPGDVPTAFDLTPYDLVIWSAPRDAPGYIDADEALAGYLSAGGRLLLSGQDVGFWDGGGAMGYWSEYYEDYLKADYVSDDAPTRVLEGVGDDIFAGLAITIAGPGGADNQDYPDVIAVADPDAAAPVLAYREGETRLSQKTGFLCGGVRVGTCLNYRAVYLSFGFEAIDDRADRREVMRRTLDWLTAPPPTVGLELQPESSLRIGPPGSVVTHTLRVRHLGQGGSTDTVSLSLDGVSWATQLSTSRLTLAPCTSATVELSVTVPPTAEWDARDEITLTARSSLSSTLVQTTVLTSKAPAPILLVDDDRWYDQEVKYEAALMSNGFPYDYWRTGSGYGEASSSEAFPSPTPSPTSASPPPASPTPPFPPPPTPPSTPTPTPFPAPTPTPSPLSRVLERYPIVVWWTGYDWYAPVTAAEEAALETYLDGGGRLFLSSQDFLYYHHEDPFSRRFLGVLTYTESLTPTLAVGVPGNSVGDGLGPWPLNYPRGYQNWSDGVVPMPGTGVSFRDQEGRGIALARRERDQATSFLAFPFEALPEEVRPTVMERAVGWLSWLGRSTFTADRGAAAPGDVLTYTLRIQNDGPDVVTASISNTLPISLSHVPGSLTGPGSYDPSERRLSWSGLLDPEEAMTLTYRATVITGTALQPIVNAARIALEDQHVRFHRAAVVRVHAPDLSPSSFVCQPPLSRPGATVTCTLALVNAGPGDAPAATAEILLPADAAFADGSLGGIEGATAEALDGTLRWTGPLDAGDQATLTYRLRLPGDPAHPPLYSVAFLEDGLGGTWERSTWLIPNPWRAYLPVVLRSAGR